MSLFSQSNARRVHVDLTESDLEKYQRGIDEQKISDIVTVIDGGGLNLLKQNVIRRFATEITKVETGDPTKLEIENNDGSSAGWVTKRDLAAAAAISGGMHTIASLFGFRNVVYNRASLFDEQSVYTYSDDKTNTDWIVDLAEDRKIALEQRRMARADVLSCGIGSAACYVSASVRGFGYNSFDPAKIWIVHADEIFLDDEKSSTDKNNIDDASVVVMLLSTGTDTTDENDYLAFFGRSENYPDGRMVKYSAQTWHSIPAPGDGGYDYTTDGVTLKPGDNIANPLTLYSNQTKNDSSVEYPIINWQMDQTADGASIFPISGTMLFDSMFELDTEFSRDIESGGRSGRGAWLGMDQNSLGFGKSISEGEMVGKRDQDVRLLSHPAVNAKHASDIVIAALEQTAGAYNVPAYKVSTKSDIQATSGFALRVMDQPLTRDRVKRANINRPSMSRKFEIERALSNFVTGDTKIPLDVSEHWEPGSIDVLETPDEKQSRLDWEFDKGLRSLVDYFAEMKQIESRDEALELLTRTREENTQFASAGQQQPAQQTGILGRRRQ